MCFNLVALKLLKDPVIVSVLIAEAALLLYGVGSIGCSLFKPNKKKIRKRRTNLLDTSDFELDESSEDLDFTEEDKNMSNSLQFLENVTTNPCFSRFSFAII